MKKNLGVALSGAVLAAAVYSMFRAGSHEPLQEDFQCKEPSAESNRPEVVDSPHTNSVETTSTTNPGSRRTTGLHAGSTTPRTGAETMSPAESARIAEAFEITGTLRGFLDDGDDASALQEARKLVSHPNREVRMAALEAMRWIGAAATTDMVSFFGDADPEISQAADEAFWDALDEIEDPLLLVRMLKIPLGSSSLEQRMGALERLVYLPEHLSFNVIAEMMNDPNEAVRNLARDNLEFISELEFDSEEQAISWFNLHKAELEQRNTF